MFCSRTWIPICTTISAQFVKKRLDEELWIEIFYSQEVEILSFWNICSCDRGKDRTLNFQIVETVYFRKDVLPDLRSLQDFWGIFLLSQELAYFLFDI